MLGTPPPPPPPPETKRNDFLFFSRQLNLLHQDDRLSVAKTLSRHFAKHNIYVGIASFSWLAWCKAVDSYL
jgi:hypothetical protein